eukprot:TRINITY_DN40128_c0_g1_i1.p1 TRINITY_DN40128_c0_g1~~TRINITY_DN40128_c0_g1_i1.p1  ORF type:complete len:332 (+),score=48.19 TRINITY_DN40128_c0_g1_i1:34-1029(+)
MDCFIAFAVRAHYMHVKLALLLCFVYAATSNRKALHESSEAIGDVCDESCVPTFKQIVSHVMRNEEEENADISVESIIDHFCADEDIDSIGRCNGCSFCQEGSRTCMVNLAEKTKAYQEVVRIARNGCQWLFARRGDFEEDYLFNIGTEISGRSPRSDEIVWEDACKARSCREASTALVRVYSSYEDDVSSESCIDDEIEDVDEMRSFAWENLMVSQILEGRAKGLSLVLRDKPCGTVETDPLAWFPDLLASITNRCATPCENGVDLFDHEPFAGTKVLRSPHLAAGKKCIKLEPLSVWVAQSGTDPFRNGAYTLQMLQSDMRTDRACVAI